uniref:t-SNARE coiled-coil homology domain-containing protein n=1 Tax=Kalanchoe fedtschenkoi TaxID=63787 RepID=A0A7N0VGG7_KALFE
MNDLMTKSFTSYVDLKKEAMKDLEAQHDNLELTAAEQQVDHDMNLFLAEAEKVKTEMNSIKEILTKLQEANEESKSLHKPDALKEVRNRINSEIVTVLKQAKRIKVQLEQMDRANASILRLSRSKQLGGTTMDRTRAAVTNGLRKKLKDLMMEFQALRQRMMAEYKESVGRSYFTVTGQTPDEEVIEKIIHNVGAEEFLARAVQEHGRGRVVETVVEIQDRHDAAKEIEKSLLELHQVFLDMAVMVEHQGEQMDDIEHNVINSSHYVKDGALELKSAKGYQKRSRKCMCLGLVLLLIIVLVLIVSVATSFTDS